MKVLQFSKFYPPVRGGIESATRELTEGLIRHGVQVDVLCANRGRHTERSPLAPGCEVLRVGTLGTLLSTSMAPGLVVHLRRMAASVDVLHLHMPDPMAALAVWLTRPSARIVLHWHSDVIRQRHAMKLYQPLQSWLLRRADAIVATSQAYLEASEPLRPWRDKVHVIPIGVADLHGRTDARKVEAIRSRHPGRRIVFTLGRMAYYKGFDVLVDAAALLPDDTVVLIGGAGELMAPLQQRIDQQGLAHRVVLLGGIDEADLADHYAACDVFCFPSTLRAEAFGIAMVEAMTVGKPVVATRIPGSGVSWINAHGATGLNMPVGDHRALAEALGQLLDDAGLRQTMGQASRQRYEAEFTSQRMAERTIVLYHHVLRSQPG